MFNNLNTEDLIKSIRGLQMTGKEQQLHYSQGKNSGTLSCAFILQTKHHNLKNKYFKQESVDAFPQVFPCHLICGLGPRILHKRPDVSVEKFTYFSPCFPSNSHQQKFTYSDRSRALISLLRQHLQHFCVQTHRTSCEESANPNP